MYQPLAFLPLMVNNQRRNIKKQLRKYVGVTKQKELILSFLVFSGEQEDA